MHQPHRGRRYERKQPPPQPELVTQDAPRLAPAHPMFNGDARRRCKPVLGLLLRRQLFGLLTCLATLLLMRQQHLRHALVGKVRSPRRSWVQLCRLTLLIQRLVRQWAGIARLNRQHLAVLISDDLRLYRVALLLARVEPALGVRQAGPSHGRLEAVYQQHVERVGMPRRLSLGPLLLGVPPVGRAQVTQHKDDLMEAVLADVGADGEHLAAGGVGNVVAQVDQGEQHLLVGMELAASAATGAAPASGLCLLLPVAAGNQFRQDSGQQVSERGGFEAEEGADTIFGKRVQLLKVHAIIFG